MPGLVGLITKLPKDEAERQLLAMLESLRHERFYTSGTYIDSTHGLYLGWIAREGSFADGMPLRNERGDVTLVFSGEDFPEPGLVAALRERGHAVAEPEPSYLVHMYEEEKEFPKALNGRFHGVVVDRALGSVMLFNDRFGLHRLYYHEGKDAFYFAAEAKAILKVRPELRQADAQSLGEFIACGCVLENRSLFTGVHVLPPASVWHFRGGAIEKKAAYFQPKEWEEQSPLSPKAYYGALRDAFVRGLPRYFKGRERVGISLTGGLDTRIIMAWHNAMPGSLPCYTFGSMYRDNQDVQLARKVARICGQPHHVITTGKEFLSRFSHYAERSLYLTDGCIDVSRSPDLYVNERAREIAPVRVVGTYGSEMLMHAVMFKATRPLPGLFQSDLSSQLTAAKHTYDLIKQVHPVTFAAFRQSPWHHFGILSLEQTQLAVRSPYLTNEFVQTLYRAPASVDSNADGRLKLIREGNPTLARLRTDRGVGGHRSLLVRGCLEFSFKAEYAYDYGMPQWLAQLDHVFARLHFERLWIGRHKVFHFRQWYRDELAGYVREILLDQRTLARPYLVPDAVRRVVKGHLAGNRNYTTELHRLLALELTHRLFLDARWSG
ncbi:MAG TPA: asparagine synthase-related protein [Bryobacteraceae bacterium]|jgi:asparagine synthase (glutamine-hydrolysing)|nr:asparagine synthase-related protein [Bryobacteraceae bacterium]